MNRFTWLAHAAIMTFVAINAAAAQEFRTYAIQAGSQYTYKPSPWIGIPGGTPSEYQLDFGVSGVFVVEFDDVADTARLQDVGLVLTGNEAVQNNPPSPFTPVTANRIEEWLEARLFHNIFTLAPWDEYAAENPAGLRLRDLLNGAVTLTGGYDGTFVDGNAMLFNLRGAIALVPEPGGIVLAGMVLAMAACARRPSFQARLPSRRPTN